MILFMKEKQTSQFFKIASKMPKLLHWPDRTEPFSYEKSEVCEWLLSHPEAMMAIFDKARNSGAIIFDPETETWKGVHS